jgi:hypothetical protein
MGLRFLPLDWLKLHPYQIVTRTPGRYAPFAPNAAIEQPPHSGELAVMGNVRPSEIRPALRFSTDALGFRANPPGTPQSFRVLAMEGDSFTFGAGLSDEDTFPAVLSRDLGAGVYNGGRFFTDPERPVEIDWLRERLAPPPSTVLYILLERFDLSLDIRYDQGRIDRIAGGVLGDTYYSVKDEMRFARRWWQLWSAVSPLGVLSTRAWKTVSNDRILPNEYRVKVVERTLPDGRRFLVEQRNYERFANPPDARQAGETAEYMAWLRSEMRQRGLNFWVVLVPEASTVYGKWLFGHQQRPVAPGGLQYLDYLERELGKRGVKTVNGLTVLRGFAERDVAGGELSFFREDHHWSPAGVRRIAAAVSEALRNDPEFPGVLHQAHLPETAHVN